MAHNHNHNHQHGEDGISIAFFLNAAFVVIELVGGLWTNSIAILSDALHDFGDCLSLAIAWLLQKKSKKGRDKSYSYGYKRYSLLGSIFLSGVLSVSSVYVIVEAAKRIADPQSVSAEGMLWLAIIGIVINGAAALRVKKGSSLNERAVFLHIMEDVLGWIAVFVVSIVMLFVDFPMLDPLLSIFISIWVLSNVFKNLKSVFRVLLQGVPEGFSIDDLHSKLETLPGISNIHDLHIWSMDGESHVVSLHAITDGTITSEQLKKEIREFCKTLNIDHVTVELENSDEHCHDKCD
jgi:cobalt-zinc-cadmium efflux system protein